MQNKILIAAGGTGGHIIPAITLSRKLRGYDFVFMCGSRQIENRVYESYSIEPVQLPMGSFNALSFMLSLPASIHRVFITFMTYRPDAVIVSGSYITSLPGIASVISGRPLFILEQDTVLGKTNRILGCFAKRIFSGFKLKRWHKNRTIHTGHIVREEIFSLEHRENISIPAGMKVILIIGGSQGAYSMTSTVLDALKDRGYFIIAVAGRSADRFRDSEYVKILPYTEEMGYLYSISDVIISRAGALSYAEIVCTGKPALFIPLPSSKDNHQVHNAVHYCRENSRFRMIEEHSLNSDSIDRTIGELLRLPEGKQCRSNAVEIIQKEIGNYV